MTLRQVLHIIWSRWLWVLATTILVLAATTAYALTTPQTYESTATLRYSVTASQTLAGPSGYAGMELDLDPFFVTSEEVLEGASAQTGAPVAELQGSTVVTPVEGVRTSRLEITSEAGSPQESQSRANAIADAYVTHLQSQVAVILEDLETDLQEADQARTDATAAVRDDPDDSVAQGQLGQALSEHLALTQQLEALQDAGDPAAVMQDAPPGGLLGTETSVLIIIGLISGLIAGCGVALLRNQFDDRMRSAQAMQDLTEQPVLAEVTVAKRRRRRDTSLPAALITPTPFNESIRNLRASLQVAHPDQPAVIAVTSPTPGDGKTFLAANLAVSMARSGRTVLFVSGDLRRPRAGAYFGLDADKEGLAEILTSDASSQDIEKLLVPTQFDRLRVLPAGLNREQPADLLAGDTLPRVIERMRELADVVLIDTPPGLAISDATLLGAQADGVVVVASLNTTSTRNLVSTLDLLNASGVAVTGLVVNRSKTTAHRSYSSYYKTAEAPRPTTEPAGGQG